jgi:hypothetical protein
LSSRFPDGGSSLAQFGNIHFSANLKKNRFAAQFLRLLAL